MIDALLSFFSNLILFTCGLAVFALWVVIIILVCVEIHDLVWEKFTEKQIEEDL